MSIADCQTALFFPFLLILATFSLQSGYKMEDLSSQEAWGEDSKCKALEFHHR